MIGRLLTEDFLSEGIRRTDAYTGFEEGDLERRVEEITVICDRFLGHEEPNEAATEVDLIYPVLVALGWRDPLVQQQASKGRKDVPDALLFADSAARERAISEKRIDKRYQHGTTFIEAKRWQRPLDRGESTNATDQGVPSNQMLRYLSQVEVASQGGILWGMLTNGRDWRLYPQRSTNRAEEFIEFDLPALLGLRETAESEAGVKETRHLLKAFILLFRPEAFLPEDGLDGRSFLEYARREARLWEARVAESLSEVVFEQVFPRLLNGFVERDSKRPTVLDRKYLDDMRDAALVFIYRLLFLLYAEDRGLLPVRDTRYDDYSLRKQRREIAERSDANDVFSQRQDRYFRQISGLFDAIADGDDSIGLPPYNGGLFDKAVHPVLSRLSLSDTDFAFALDSLSRRRAGAKRLWINFRDLSVQQLGSIYERLLEFRAVAPDGQNVEVEQGIYSRRTSGSYYTPESLVQLTLERTLGPLVEERRLAFLEKLDELNSSRKRFADRIADLATLDPASRILDLKVIDPAMGGGHFLVSAVDYLADRTLELVAEAEEKVGVTGWKLPYTSPLTLRLADIREHILQEAEQHGWPVEEANLDDRHLVRRILLKRVIYGVDLNPMAVELAKLALWLHSFTVGAPLSFLDHHLRFGNSLVGSWVDRVRERIEWSGFWGSAFDGVLGATEMMRTLEEMSDADIAEVKASASLFGRIETALQPYRSLLALDMADDWFDVGQQKGDKGAGPDKPGRDVLMGLYGDPTTLVRDPQSADQEGVAQTVTRALITAGDLHAFPWELMFPEVWYEKGRRKHNPGFDAVIGNPPWDRVKLQQVEFFSERRPEISQAGTAAERKRKIKQLGKVGDPLWDDYRKAANQAEAFAAYARRCGHFPNLSGGDVNLYALFVERAVSLVRGRGMVGLLVPSGIAGDKGKATFFGGLATSGRLSTLFDFENKGAFKDVDSRFKFSLLVAGGSERTFPAAECAFYLHDTAELEDPERSFELTPEDFLRVNPNTRTAPVFRTRRDAELTRAVYNRLPVLVDHSAGKEANPWGIKYLRMFDMTNDSGLFRSVEQLEDDGFYPVEGNRWKKGVSEYVPLYEGKMVQLYDHRAASVEVDTSRTHRPGQPVAATEEQHVDPAWFPDPQFWVEARAVEKALSDKWAADKDWFLGFKEITAPTNQRTMIAAILPRLGAGNKVPLLVGDEESSAIRRSCLLASMNSFAFDFVLRQKLAGQTINLYILEQLPIPSKEAFGEKIGGATIADLVAERVLRLSYTAHDLAGFATDLEYEGEPFEWDEEERRHHMAQLDALMFRLYGITDQADVKYILSTFPIIRRQDEATFGSYRTQALILAYLRAHNAGDVESRMAV